MSSNTGIIEIGDPGVIRDGGAAAPGIITIPGLIGALPLGAPIGIGIGVGIDILFPNNPFARLGGAIGHWLQPWSNELPIDTIPKCNEPNLLENGANYTHKWIGETLFRWECQRQNKIGSDALSVIWPDFMSQSHGR